MLAITVSFGAALLWGLADFIGGLESRQASGLAVVLLSQATGLAAACVFALIAVMVADPAFTAGAVVWAAAAGALIALGVLAFYRALAIGTMSIVAPLSATGVVLPVIVGLVKGDSPGGVQLAGMAIGAAGALLATLDAETDAERRARARTSVALALATAVLIGLALVAFDRAAEDGVAPTLVWAKSAAVLVLGALALAFRPDLRIERTHRAPIAAIGLLDVSATGLFALATTEGFLSVVAVISSLYPAVTVVLAHAFLHERVRSVQMVGVLGAFVGVALVAAGA